MKVTGGTDNPVDFEITRRGRTLRVRAPHDTREPLNEVSGREYAASLKLVVSNQEKVLENRSFFFCEDGGGHLGCLYLAGGVVPLGILLLLWRRGEFLDRCKTCGGPLHLTYLAGSPLSGNHQRSGYCLACLEPRSGSAADGTGTMQYYPLSFAQLRREHPNGVVRKGAKLRRFDWADGIVGEDEPDTVLQPRVQPATFLEVVWTLRGGLGRA